MKKIIAFIITLCLSPIALSGCGKDTTDIKSPSHIVTGLEILCAREEETYRLRYTDEEKIRPYLLYLRILDTGSAPRQDPESLPHVAFEIHLRFLDGGSRVYRQVAHRYLQVDDRPWKTLDPCQAAQLYTLMQTIPEDPFPV